MRDQRFGIEIELTGLTRCQASKVVGDYFQTTPVHVGGGYDSYSIRDGDDRLWKVMSDASIHCECRGREAGSLYSVEVVSPICQYGDIETIQEIVRKLRESGAKANNTCGIHVHVDASSHTPTTLRNIVNIMAAKEDLIYKALKVDVAREHYCKKWTPAFWTTSTASARKHLKSSTQSGTKAGTAAIITTTTAGIMSLTCTVCFPRGRLNFVCSIPPPMPAKSKHISSFALPSAIRRLPRNVLPAIRPKVRTKSIRSGHGC